MWWLSTILGALVGVALAGASIRLLGRVRAAASWPDTRSVRPVTGALARLGTGSGVALCAVALGAFVAGLAGPGTLAVLVGLAGLTGGAAAAQRLIERAELTALIRTPSIVTNPTPPGPAPIDPESDPEAAPAHLAILSDGAPGWVYRDADGAWYLAVSTPGEDWRLVSLPDFTLLPRDRRAGRLALAGSVRLAVHPVQDGDPVPTPLP